MNLLIAICVSMIVSLPIEPNVQWNGKVTSDSLEKLSPTSGFFADAESLSKAWKAWRPAEDVPAVDFANELVIVGVVRGPNSALMRPVLDDRGDLQFAVAGNKVAGSGFGYLMLKINREGVISMNGNGLEGRCSKVEYDNHDGYFVSNKFEPDAASSFVCIKTSQEFDAVFGSAFVTNDKSHRLPVDCFKSKMVVAAIHRGNALWEYRVKSVESDGKTLIVRYTTTNTPQKSATFSCPLILSIPQGDYSTLQFVENGKCVKSIENHDR